MPDYYPQEKGVIRRDRAGEFRDVLAREFGSELLGLIPGAGILKKILKPLSKLTKVDRKIIEDKIYDKFKLKTKAVESPTGEWGGYKSNVMDINPTNRVTASEVRDLITSQGYDANPIDASGAFRYVNHKALKRFRGGKLTGEDKDWIKKTKGFKGHEEKLLDKPKGPLKDAYGNEIDLSWLGD